VKSFAWWITVERSYKFFNKILKIERSICWGRIWRNFEQTRCIIPVCNVPIYATTAAQMVSRCYYATTSGGPADSQWKAILLLGSRTARESLGVCAESARRGLELSTRENHIKGLFSAKIVVPLMLRAKSYLNTLASDDGLLRFNSQTRQSWARRRPPFFPDRWYV